MKRSIRLPFSLLFIIAIFTILTCREALIHGLAGTKSFNQPLLPSSPLNETLILLASADPSLPDLKKDVDKLLDGNLPQAGRLHSVSSWRRENRYQKLESRARFRHPIRLRAPKDYQIFPEFRIALRNWFHSRHFQPMILSHMLSLVKDPIDRHQGLLPTTRPYPSCAVVGNSGILLQQEQGSLIDSHHMVIRLNNARITGYQRSVGSKTGLSFVNSNILHLCTRRQGCFCHPYGESVPMIMYICQTIHFLDYTICNSSHKAPLLITDPGFDLLCARIVKYYSLKRFVEETGKPPEEWVKTHDERMFHYSSGMQAIVLALGICDEVSIFGFGKSAEAKHHYHTNQKAELDLHDYEAEYAFYRDLVERPQVIPFLKDSGMKVPPVVFYH